MYWISNLILPRPNYMLGVCPLTLMHVAHPDDFQPDDQLYSPDCISPHRSIWR